MIALLWVVGSWASTFQPKVVPCPMGSGGAKIYEIVSTNQIGGYDADGAMYAQGGQARTYKIGSCDENLFTLYGRDMTTPIPADQRARYEKALKAVVGTLADPKSPSTWERYRIAAAMYAEMGKPPAFLGDLYLEASWTARDEAVGFLPGLNGALTTRTLLDNGLAELKKPLSVADRKKVLYNLARVAERGGYAPERDALLAAFEAAGPMDAAESAAVARFRKMVVIEASLQDLAIAQYQRALAGKLDDITRLRVTYTLAELLRRRGQWELGRPLYQAVVAASDADPTQRQQAQFFLQEGPPRRPPAGWLQ